MPDAGLVTLGGQLQTLDGQVIAWPAGLIRTGGIEREERWTDDPGADLTVADVLWYETSMESLVRRLAPPLKGRLMGVAEE